MSRTSSFRLSDKLHERLDRFARRQRRAKNSVIVQAVEIYLDQHEQRNLAAEARRQSLLATTGGGDADWLDHADQTGWK
jgi:predicted DNA-binding protein